MQLISGAKILNFYDENGYCLKNNKITILIIRFSNQSSYTKSQILASDISTAEKIRTFANLSFKVKYQSFKINISTEEIVNTLKAFEEDSTIDGLIIQNPVPKNFNEIICKIPLKKNIDNWALNDEIKLPATVEAIYRLIQHFEKHKPVIAIVGYKGYIGEKLVKLYYKKSVELILIDKNDSFEKLKKANIIISATGQKGIISKSNLSENLLLGIDVGVFIDDDMIVEGDFQSDTHYFFKFFSPSPGGIGPLSISILVERIYEKFTGVQIKKWQLSDVIN